MNKFAVFFILTFSCSVVCAQNSTDETLAYQYYQQGEYDKAALLFGKIFNTDDNEGYFDIYYGSLLKIKKYNEAEELVKKLIKKYPQKTNYQVALGKIYQERGAQSEATKIYLTAIQNVPKTEFNYRELANSFYGNANLDMAISAFLQGRKVLGNESLFAFELLSIYRAQKNKPQLVAEYLNVLSENPQVLFQAQGTFANIFDSNSDYIMLQNALLKKMQKEPDNEIFVELLTWQYIQQQNYEMALRQLIAQDKRTKNVSAMIYNTANTFVNNKAFTTATKAYEYLLTKGVENDFFVASKIQLINTKYELAMQNRLDKAYVKTLAADFQAILKEYGLNKQTFFAAKKLAYLQAYKLDNLAEAEKTLEQILATNEIGSQELAEIKLDLGDIYILSKQPWEALLAYEQVAKTHENEPIGSDAKFRSARLSFYQGNFQFSKSQADVLKASTSQLIANDALNLSLLISDNLQQKDDSLALIMYADAEMLQFTNNLNAALKKLDSIDIAYPNNSLADDILMTKSKIFLKSGNYNEVETSLLKLIETYSNSIWIDDAMFMLADLYESKLNKPTEAKKYFQLITTDYPGSMLNEEARKRYRNMQANNLGT